MIWAKKRFEVLKRDGYRCQYCWKTWKDVTLEVDHIIPKSKWGGDEFKNLITCCRECNMGKWQTELNELNSNFNIKVKDLNDRIKKEFYRIWNTDIKAQEEYKGKKINWTIEVNTMSLMASFLQWRINNRISTPQKVKDLIKEKIEELLRIEKEWNRRGYETIYIENHPTIVELKNDMSLIDGKVAEFFEWGDFFDELTQDFDWDFIANDCYFGIVCQDDRRNTSDMDKRLNYTISLNINEYGNVPNRILRKYSLFPNAKREW